MKDESSNVQQLEQGFVTLYIAASHHRGLEQKNLQKLFVSLTAVSSQEGPERTAEFVYKLYIYAGCQKGAAEREAAHRGLSKLVMHPVVVNAHTMQASSADVENPSRCTALRSVPQVRTRDSATSRSCLVNAVLKHLKTSLEVAG